MSNTDDLSLGSIEELHAQITDYVKFEFWAQTSSNPAKQSTQYQQNQTNKTSESKQPIDLHAHLDE